MEFEVLELGLIDFQKAWQFQKEVFKAVKNGILQSALIICQHYPVITLGRQADEKNILLSVHELKSRRIGVCKIERGGDVTYHGPGQITAYPIFNLNYLKRDIHWFLRQLEEVIIDCLSDFGINGQRWVGLTGVWVGEQKIASIGIAIRNWITFHGLSINIKKEDLEIFRLIRPCGMDIEMTALEVVLDRNIEISNIKNSLIHKFRDVFKLKAVKAAKQKAGTSLESIGRVSHPGTPLALI